MGIILKLTLDKSIFLAFLLAILSSLILLATSVIGFTAAKPLFIWIVPLNVAWAVALSFAFWKYRRRAWPTILSAPLALWWLFFIVWIDYVCRTRHDCL